MKMERSESGHEGGDEDEPPLLEGKLSSSLTVV
jgi:hypothetical protein